MHFLLFIVCVPVVTRHQPRPNMSRDNPAGPDVPHSERTGLLPVPQPFPPGDADVADTFKDNPQTVIDMGEDTEDDRPPAVSSPSADSKAPSDLGTIQSHYKAIKSEYSPIDTEPVSDNFCCSFFFGVLLCTATVIHKHLIQCLL